MAQHLHSSVSECRFFRKDHYLHHETKNQLMHNLDRIYLQCLKRNTWQKHKSMSEEFHSEIEEMGIAEGECFTPMHLTKFHWIRDGQEGQAKMKHIKTQSSGAGSVWSNPYFEGAGGGVHTCVFRQTSVGSHEAFNTSGKHVFDI